MSETPDLDLTAIEKRLAELSELPWSMARTSYSGVEGVSETVGYIDRDWNRLFVVCAPTDMAACIAEIHRLRGLLATEQAKTAHARDWCAYYYDETDEFRGSRLPDQWYQRAASDGWTPEGVKAT